MSAPVETRRVGDAIAIVTLNRPEVLNAMNTALAHSIVESLGALAKDRKVRVVILTGAGNRAFCAGADLKERLGMTGDQWRAQHEVFEHAFGAIRDFPKPIFAAVNGIAAGGGSEIALNTDFIIAVEGARFGQPEVKLGIIPGGGGTQLLPRRVPLGFARQLLMTGELIDAPTALRLGLIISVHPAERLIGDAVALAEKIAAVSPAAIRETRLAIREGIALEIGAAVNVELAHYANLVDHPDRHEGIGAFNEKRTPVFQDPE